MATHSSVLAWRIPRTGEPGGLPSIGSHRVGHDWSNLAAVAAAAISIHITKMYVCYIFAYFFYSSPKINCHVKPIQQTFNTTFLVIWGICHLIASKFQTLRTMVDKLVSEIMPALWKRYLKIKQQEVILSYESVWLWWLTVVSPSSGGNRNLSLSDEHVNLFKNLLLF